MKLKDWLLWLCVAGFIIAEALLFSANRQKDALRVQLGETRTEVDQLQEQVDQLKKLSVATLSSENARLRAENQGLSQKFTQQQKEISQLRASNQQLTQQLENAHVAVQQQQQQLQQIQAENQQANAAPETAAESSAPAVAVLNACINNLRQIDAAKQQWALENDRPANAVPTAADLLPYFRDGLFPACPAGGLYSLNAVGLPPTCSIPGHALPQ
jgi:chromosome segregation ATPase